MATNERTEEQVILDTEALKLKTRGWTYRAIAAHFGISVSTAHTRCKRALAMIPAEVVEEYRALEMERLDALLEVAMRKALDPDNKSALFAVDRALAIADRRAKLMGLDAPIKTQTEVVTYDGSSIEAEVAKLRRILSEHGGEPVSVDGQAGPTGATAD